MQSDSPQAHEQAQGGFAPMPDDGVGRPPWRARDVALAGVAALALGIAPGAALARLLGEDSAALGTLLILATIGAFVISVWLVAVKLRGGTWGMLGARRGRVSVPHGLGLAAAALAASVLGTALYVAVVSALGLDLLLPSQNIDELLGSGIWRWVNFALLGVATPAAEELFFRGFLLAALLRVMPAAAAVAASAGVFAVVHLDIGALLPIFATGALLGWLYMRTASIWPPTLAHGAQNLLAMTVANQPVSAALN